MIDSTFRILVLASAILSISVLGRAQTRRSDSATNSRTAGRATEANISEVPLTHPVARRLLAIEDRLDAAIRTKTNVDSTFERYLAKDWYDIGPHGDIYNRAQMIAIVKSNSDRIERTETSDVIVRVYGSVAVFTAKTHEIGKRVDGRPYDEPYRWMDVFHRRGNRWQIVVSESTLMPPPPSVVP